jgi:hypothetical protein
VDLALGHPDLPGRYLVAVETDGDRYVATTSQRERDRLHAERLESAGWATERVWSWALFSDPEGEAERIHRAVDHARAQFLDVDPARSPEGVGTIRHRLPRPQIPAGHPLSFYASEDFDAVVECGRSWDSPSAPCCWTSPCPARSAATRNGSERGGRAQGRRSLAPASAAARGHLLPDREAHPLG